jgi:DEAD/DEAH box helicase domain-containing protein
MSNSASDLRTVVFDIETKRLAKDVGGWDALRAGRGGVSVIVLWDSTSGRFHFYDEHTLDAAAAHLEASDVVLSFNGEGFDVPVVEGLLGRRLALKHHYDLLQLIWGAIAGRRKGNTLGEVAQRSLGVSKSGESVLAPALYDAGRFAELFDYACGDVDLTRRLFRFVQEHGGVVGQDGNLLELPLPDLFRFVNLGSLPKEQLSGVQ